jgi:hypothetical protein
VSAARIKPALLLIAGGLALRAWLAVSDMPMIYPDEHFQTLEPASRAVYGFGWMSWEWTEGIRSWVVPGLFMPVLLPLKLLGFKGGPAAIHLCRLWLALWSGAALWGFHRLLLDRGIRPIAHFVSLALLCFSPAMAIWSAATFSESWALALLWGLMPATLRALESDDPKRWTAAGIFLGLTFTLRLQMLAWAPGLALLFVWRASDRRILVRLIIGYLVPVALQGLLDWATWGYPFHSAIRNVSFNVIQGVADLNGRSPWHHYFALIWNDLGAGILIPMLALVAMAAIRARLRLRTRDARVLVPAAGFVLAHLVIGHKETRFVLPAFPALFYLLALALDGLCEGLPTADTVIRYCALGSLALIPLCARLARNPARFSYLDRSALCLAIDRDGGLRRDPAAGLLLVESSWVWTRGELLFGGPVAYREARADRVSARDAEGCRYAIVPGDFEREFRRRTRKAVRWTRLKRDAHGNVLLKRR